MIPPTEAVHPAAVQLHHATDADALDRLLAAQAGAVGAVRAALPALARAAAHLADALRGPGRVIYAGAGTGGLMALADALELPGTFGIAPDRLAVLLPGGAAAMSRLTGAPEDVAADGAADLARLGPGPDDVVICVSASGSTPYTLALARAAQAAGARVIALACVPGAPLLAAADVAVLLDTGPEMVAGSTRLGAGTAQKVALNLVSTLAGLRLGHVHGGRMVNHATDNAKLRARALRTIVALAGCDETTARRALDAADGQVKPAVVAAATGIDPQEAARRVAAADGGLAALVPSPGGAAGD